MRPAVCFPATALRELAERKPEFHPPWQALHRLVGGKPVMAGQALPPTADAGSLVRGAGVNDLAFQVGTIRTSHGGSPSLCGFGEIIP